MQPIDNDKIARFRKDVGAMDEIFGLPLGSGSNPPENARVRGFRLLVANGHRQTAHEAIIALAELIKRSQVPRYALEYARYLIVRSSVMNDMDPEVLGLVVRFILRCGISLGGDRQKIMGSEVVGLINRLDPLVRRLLARGIVLGSQERTRQALSRLNHFPRLKQILVAEVGATEVAKALGNLDTEGVRETVLRGLRNDVILGILDHLGDPQEYRIAVWQETYECFISRYPANIENFENGGLLPNHYRDLGVPRWASLEMIKTSYRKYLMKAYHPDCLATEGQEAQDRAKPMARTIIEAWQVLGDPAERKAYNGKISDKIDQFPDRPWYQLLEWFHNRSSLPPVRSQVVRALGVRAAPSTAPEP